MDQCLLVEFHYFVKKSKLAGVYFGSNKWTGVSAFQGLLFKIIRFLSFPGTVSSKLFSSTAIGSNSSGKFSVNTILDTIRAAGPVKPEFETNYFRFKPFFFI